MKKKTKIKRMTNDERLCMLTAKMPFVIRPEASGQAELQAAAGDVKVPTFNMLAYTGGAMRVSAFYYPVVIDLAGAKASPEVVILRNHDPDRVCGMAEKVNISSAGVQVSGSLCGTDDEVEPLVKSSQRGFKWKASVGGPVLEANFVKEGATVTVNGQTFTGPINVARQWRMDEVSFVALAADARTATEIAASAAEEFAMTYEQWLEAKGFQNVTEDQKAILRAAYDAEQGNDEPETPAAPEKKIVQAAAAPAQPASDGVADLRAAHAAETTRIAGIRKACGGDSRYADIEAKAINDGWSPEKAELEVLRASRPKAPAIGGGTDAQVGAKVLEAAIRLNSAEPEKALLASYGEETLDRASKYRRMGLREFIAACCAIEGRQAPAVGSTEHEVIQAAFSTVSVPGILSNVAHKSMLAAYQMVPSKARMLFKKLSASDFKTHTGYRMTGNVAMTPVGSDGELKHFTLGEETFSYAVNTVGHFIGLTRVMLTNDDLGAFVELPRMIGRGAGIALETDAWKLVLANTGNFFHGNNRNYISGGTSVLSAASLALAVQKFLDQKDADGNPIMIDPEYLVVPTALDADAAYIYASTNLNTGGSSTKDQVPNANIWKGRYQPITVPHLSNSAVHANASSTAWYLAPNPNTAAAFGIAYLNGNENPVIEEVQPSPQFLGRCWRGYFDYGVTQIDPKCWVKSAGA